MVPSGEGQALRINTQKQKKRHGRNTGCAAFLCQNAEGAQDGRIFCRICSGTQKQELKIGKKWVLHGKLGEYRKKGLKKEHR